MTHTQDFSASAIWFYLNADNEATGPFTLHQLQSFAAAGSISQETLVAQSGGSSWTPFSSLTQSTKSNTAPPPLPSGSSQANPVSNSSSSPVFALKGHGNQIAVFEDRVELTPIGFSGFVNHGLKGTKSIPVHSITAIQLKEAGLLTIGYLQFTIAGGKESKGGMFAAATDENTFSFARKGENNETVKRIKDYIESKLRELRQPVAQAPASNAVSLSDELRKLAELKTQGVLSEQEFQAAKQRLLA